MLCTRVIFFNVQRAKRHGIFSIAFRKVLKKAKYYTTYHKCLFWKWYGTKEKLMKLLLNEWKGYVIYLNDYDMERHIFSFRIFSQKASAHAHLNLSSLAQIYSLVLARLSQSLNYYKDVRRYTAPIKGIQYVCIFIRGLKSSERSLENNIVRLNLSELAVVEIHLV